MGHIGGVFLIYSFVAGVAACLAFSSGKFKNGILVKYGSSFKVLQSLFLWASLGMLATALFSNDFSLYYVAGYSDLSLPDLYKASVIWSAPEGFFLFLAAVLSSISLIENLRLGDKDGVYYKILNFITSFVPLLITLLVIFVINPFREMDFTPVNGQGLNPLLQNIPMFLYPLWWTLFFASSFIVFSWGLSALILKDYGTYWLKSSARWVFFSVAFMAAALFSKGLASFMRISHSGFWDWDIMETASVIIFIILIAFMHSMIICLNKGRKKRLCLVLCLIIFEFALLSLFMAGSSGASYISSFNPGYSIYILPVVLVSSAIFLIFFIKSYNKLNSHSAVILRPKELAVNIADSIIFIAAIFIFAGLILQIYGEENHYGAFLNPSYYIAVVAPASLLCMGLMGILALRLYAGRDHFKAIRLIYAFVISSIICVFGAVLIFKIKILPAVFFCATVFSAISMTAYVFKASHKHSLREILKNRRLYARILTHMGFLIVCLGVVLSTSYYKEHYVETVAGRNFQAGGYNFLVSGVNSLYKDNYLYTFVDISVEKNGKIRKKMSPQIRSYDNSRKLYAEMEWGGSFLSSFSLAFISYDFKGGDIELFIAEYPGVQLIPAGMFIMILGVLYSAFGKRFFNE